MMLFSGERLLRCSTGEEYELELQRLLVHSNDKLEKAILSETARWKF